MPWSILAAGGLYTLCRSMGMLVAARRTGLPTPSSFWRRRAGSCSLATVSYTHLRAHETSAHL
eukprot:5197999-Alexandrium_andersonii.AAC.1